MRGEQLLLWEDKKQIILEQRLKTIEKLYNKGILSQDEYNKKRQEVLSGI